MSEPESIKTIMPRVIQNIQARVVTEDQRRILRLIAEVFPGTTVLWNGAWRPLKVKQP